MGDLSFIRVNSLKESQITELKSTEEEFLAFNEFCPGSIHEDMTFQRIN